MRGDNRSINGGKNVLYPEHISFTHGGKKSMCQKILIALVVVHFLIDGNLTKSLTSFVSTEKRSDRAKPGADPEICNTRECREMAKYMTQKMDKDVDPCEDFNEYACGYINRNKKYPAGGFSTNAFHYVRYENEKVIREILEEKNKDGDPKYLKNMRNFYQSCIDKAQVDKIGLATYLTSSYAKEFPALNPSWNPAGFNLNDLIQRYMKVFVQPLFRFYISGYYTHSSNKNIFLSDPAQPLPKEDLNQPRNGPLIQALEKYWKDFFIALHADKATAAEDAKDLVDFEIQLAMIKLTEEEKWNHTAQYNPTTLAELSNMYTVTDLRRALLAAFSTTNITLAEDEIIINEFPSYMEQLQTLLRDANPRTLQNLFGARYATTYVEGLTKRLRQIAHLFRRRTSTLGGNVPRWNKCVTKVKASFGWGLSKQFVNRAYSEESKEYILKMFANLKSEFRQILEEITWMTNETKAVAYEKLSKMGADVGNQEDNYEEADLEKKYRDYKMLPDQFYENSKLITMVSSIEKLENYRKPVDKKEWNQTPIEAKAYYDFFFNKIVVTAGILQLPFFSTWFHDAFNYGAIGAIIGRELTYGFNDLGSHLDANGIPRTWWQKSDIERYEAKAQCIIDQYESYRVEKVGINLNGIETRHENIADNGGLKESFRAYKRYISQKDHKPLKLPALGLNNDQLFFVAYAQIWCEKSTTVELWNMILNDFHSPGEFRIKGPLQNSEDFAKAYNCPVGSPMNPKKKCGVW